MKKIILCTFILASLLGFIGYYIASNNNNEYKLSDENKEIFKTNDNESKLEEIKDEPITEVVENSDVSNENINNIDYNISKNDLESNTVSNSDVINNVTKVEEKQEQVIEKPKVETTVEPQPKQETSVKEISAWDSLGISEYDYYHKPMWSWARIDFSINDYGSFEQTHQACIDVGENLENIMSFSCTTINSYSGDYLGDMLRTK